MLNKLRLDQANKYEQAIATYEIADMLIHFALVSFGGRGSIYVDFPLYQKLRKFLQKNKKLNLLQTMP